MSILVIFFIVLHIFLQGLRSKEFIHRNDPPLKLLISVRWMWLNGQSKYSNNTIHGFVLPANSTAAIRICIPETWAGSMQTGSILLHYDACNNVFEGFIKLRELIETLLNNIWIPLIHFVVLIWATPNCIFNRLLNYVWYVINDKSKLFGTLKIIHVFVWKKIRMRGD